MCITYYAPFTGRHLFCELQSFHAATVEGTETEVTWDKINKTSVDFNYVKPCLDLIQL